MTATRVPADASLCDAARDALAAAALLLRAPDACIRAQLQAAGSTPVPSLAVLRQSFYDRFCIPQSGLYIPPYEHVFRRRERIAGRWHFPPARYGGADEVEAIYARFGFRPTQLDADPILRAPHLPGDHLGFMLAFVGWTLQTADWNPATRRELAKPLAAFIAAHLDRWLEAYGWLLQESEPHGYAAAVGEAVVEARRTLEDLRRKINEPKQDQQQERRIQAREPCIR